MTHVRLEPIESEDDTPLGLGHAPEAISILQRQSQQFIIASKRLVIVRWATATPRATKA